MTRVGPGTPMGELMRRYWHPIAGSSELNDDTPTREVRLLGEDLVLFRSAAGVLGLVEPSCAHRKASLAYGIPEPDGIRCAYHGWVFDAAGKCVEQPSEPADSSFKEKVAIKAYPVQELGGLVFAYMGPSPAPLLPNYEILVRPGTRSAWSVELPCNWLQCHENSLDPLHFQWLHRYWGGWQMGRLLPKDQRDTWNDLAAARGADHRKIGFEITGYGVIKRRLVGDETEEGDHWRMGHPIFFPNVLWVGPNLQFRVPVDDTTTLHLMLDWHPVPVDGAPSYDSVPFRHVALYNNEGKIDLNYDVPGADPLIAGAIAQDQTAWIIEGPIMDRTTERLGVSDIGIIMFRRLLEDQMQLVGRGLDPMNTYRNPASNVVIQAPCERFEYMGYEGVPRGPFSDIAVRNDVEAVLSGDGAPLKT